MNKFILDSRYGMLLETVGISATEALKKALLPEDLFAHKIPVMTPSEYYRFMDSIRSLSNDSELPIKLGSFENIETFSPPIFAAFCSKNTTTCLKRLARYKKLIGPMGFLVTEDSDNIVLEITSGSMELELPELLVETEFVFLINLIRSATKEAIIPLSITLKNRLSSDVLSEYWGVAPTVSNVDSITISLNDAEKPYISQNEAMWDYFEPELKKRLSELAVNDSFGARVRSALIELLPSGESGIDDVAKKLGISKRTLQRKLNDENTTFQKQLNHIRELLAKHYIQSSDITSEDIAYLLGYQDINSFLRAFNLWTGMTISEYKKML